MEARRPPPQQQAPPHESQDHGREVEAEGEGMKIQPLRKYSHFSEYAKVSVYHVANRTQVEIYEQLRSHSIGGYLNAPKAFVGADVRYIDGRWCWVLDDKAQS